MAWGGDYRGGAIFRRRRDRTGKSPLYSSLIVSTARITAGSGSVTCALMFRVIKPDIYFLPNLPGFVNGYHQTVGLVIWKAGDSITSICSVTCSS